MRTNIEIDNKLINTARRLSRAKTKKQLVDIALRNLIRTLKKKELLKLYGKVKWEGNLKDMRS